MSNPFYVASGSPGQGSQGLSVTMRTEFANIEAGFNKLPDYTTAPANGLVVVNSNNTGFTTTQAVVLGGSFTTFGAFNLTLTLGATINLTLPTANDTLVGRATTDTLTNKTFDTAGTGNVFKINGTQVSAKTGSGSMVLATSPTLVTPVLGVATATSINGLAIGTSTGTFACNSAITMGTTIGTTVAVSGLTTIKDFTGLTAGAYVVHMVKTGSAGTTGTLGCLIVFDGSAINIIVASGASVFSSSGTQLKVTGTNIGTGNGNYNFYMSQLTAGGA